MRLKEFVDNNGNKVNLPKSGKTPVSAPKNTGNNSSAGFKKRLEKLVDYHIAHKNKSVDKIVERYIADYGFIYSEHHGDGIGGYTNKIVMLIDKDENWEYSVFMDDKKLTQKSGKTWEKFVSSISDYLALPLVTSDPDYQELLKEFVDTKGNKVNLKNIKNSSTTSQSASSTPRNYQDQTDRYKRLLAQIDSDKSCKYTLNSLTDRILDITVDTKFKNDIVVKIVYKPYVPCYTLQAYDKTVSDLTYEDVLDLLAAAKIINNTDLCESTSIAEDFVEWVDSSGNKITIPSNNTSNNTSQNISPAAQVNPLDQTERYKKLLAKIDSEKNYTYKLKDLSSRILAFVIDFGKSDYVYIRIIFSPRNQTYLVQVVGDDDYRYDSWDEVLKLLVSIRVIKNTYNCESLDISYADDFKLYENLWD